MIDGGFCPYPDPATYGPLPLSPDANPGYFRISRILNSSLFSSTVDNQQSITGHVTSIVPGTLTKVEDTYHLFLISKFFYSQFPTIRNYCHILFTSLPSYVRGYCGKIHKGKGRNLLDLNQLTKLILISHYSVGFQIRQFFS